MCTHRLCLKSGIGRLALIASAVVKDIYIYIHTHTHIRVSIVLGIVEP